MQSSNIPVLFITYNRLDYTKQSLPVLIENTPGARLIVIDNGSTDGTVEYLNEFQPGTFELILNKDNLGLGCAMNQFFEMTKDAEIIAKVDNDTVVPHLWLEDMVGALNESGFDILQAAHYFVSTQFNGWDQIKEQSEVVRVKNNDIIVRSSVGGAGVVMRRSIIKESLPEGRGLSPWGEWQALHPDLKKGFYEGVWVDLLDMKKCNRHKSDIDTHYYRRTGRIAASGEAKVSIIIPVVRPDGAKRCIDSIKEKSGLEPSQYEILSLTDDERIGCPKMVKRLTDMAQYDLVCFLADDTEIKQDCLSNAVRAMNDLPDGWGVVGLADGTGRQLPTHWLAHKKMLEYTGGEFFSTEYLHGKCDTELWDIAQELGRYLMCENAEFIHHHPSLAKKPELIDADYERIFSEKIINADITTYVKRKRARLGKTAIGFPLVDPTVPVQFFASFACMAKPTEYTLLVPQFPHGPWTGSIADARNSLVHQAQKDGAKYLLMLDTDQVYPPETLTRLLSHNLEVCGVRVHRRWMPFDPIFYRGSLGKYISVSDDEAFSGDVIEVDATGTGCLLFDMEVFDKIPYPWFQFHHHEGKPVGEDIYFCHQTREAGIKIHVDTAIEVGHLTTIEVNKVLYQVCKPMRQSSGITR